MVVVQGSAPADLQGFASCPPVFRHRARPMPSFSDAGRARRLFNDEQQLELWKRQGNNNHDSLVFGKINDSSNGSAKDSACGKECISGNGSVAHDKTSVALGRDNESHGRHGHRKVAGVGPSSMG